VHIKVEEKLDPILDVWIRPIVRDAFAVEVEDVKILVLGVVPYAIDRKYLAHLEAFGDMNHTHLGVFQERDPPLHDLKICDWSEHHASYLIDGVVQSRRIDLTKYIHHNFFPIVNTAYMKIYDILHVDLPIHEKIIGRR
jgi:hypothetical protein